MTATFLARFAAGASILGLLACNPAAAPSTGGTTGSTTQANPIDGVTLPKGTEVLFWHANSGEPGKLLESLVDEFNKTNEYGITVKAEFAGNYTQTYQKSLAAIQANATPDLVAAYESMAADYYKADKLVPFDQYVASTKYGLSKDDVADFVPAYFEGTKFKQFDNRQLTFPFAKSALMMWTNLDVLKQAGFTKPAETWDEFYTHLRAATKQGNKGFAVSTDASNLNGVLFSFGGDPTGNPPASKVGYEGDAGLKALRMYETVAKEKLGYISAGFDFQNDLAAGRALYAFSSSTSAPFFRPLFNDDSKWTGSLLPQENLSRKATVLYGGNISMFKSTPEKQLAAWLFVKWWNSKGTTVKWAANKATGYFPVRVSAVNDPIFQAYLKESPVYAGIFEASKFGKVEPSVPGSQEVRSVVSDVLTQIVNGQADAMQAQRTLVQKGNEKLADAR